MVENIQGLTYPPRRKAFFRHHEEKHNGDTILLTEAIEPTCVPANSSAASWSCCSVSSWRRTERTPCPSCWRAFFVNRRAGGQLQHEQARLAVRTSKAGGFTIEE